MFRTWFAYPYSRAAVMTILALIAYYLYATNVKDQNNWSLASEIGAVLLVSGLIAVYDWISKDAPGSAQLSTIAAAVDRLESAATGTAGDLAELSDRLPSYANVVVDGGVLSVAKSRSPSAYAKILRSPGPVTIVMNDGDSWTKKHEDLLRERFAVPSSETNVVLSDPSLEATLGIRRLSEKVEDTRLRLEEWQRSAGGAARLNVGFLARPIRYSGFISDESLLMVLLRTTPGAHAISLELDPEGVLAEWLRNDIVQMLESAGITG